MNDEEVESKLARWRLARPPSDLMRRLHAAAPPSPARQPRSRAVGWWLGGWPWRSWPLAYAGLLAAWVLILALRLLTPSGPPPVARSATVQTDLASANAPVLAGTLAAERTIFLTRNDPDPL